MKKNIPTIAFILFLQIFLTACKENSTQQQAGIVILSPALVEIIYFLDEDWSKKNIAAVGDYTSYPKSALVKKAALGSILNINFESLLKVNPRQVFIQGKNSKLKTLCTKRQIQCKTINIETLDDIDSTMASFAKIIATTTASTHYRQWQQKKNNLLESTQAKNNFKIFLALHRLNKQGSIYLTAGQNSFIQNLLDVAKIQSIFTDKVGWPRVSLEDIILRKPDYIWEFFEPRKLNKEKKKKIISFWKKYLPDAKVAFIESDHALIPGPRILDNLYLFNKLMQGYD